MTDSTPTRIHALSYSTSVKRLDQTLSHIIILNKSRRRRPSGVPPVSMNVKAATVHCTTQCAWGTLICVLGSESLRILEWDQKGRVFGPRIFNWDQRVNGSKRIRDSRRRDPALLPIQEIRIISVLDSDFGQA